MSKIKFEDLGRSVFFFWSQLDSLAQHWTSERFVNSRREYEVHSYVARDKDSLNIELTGLSFNGLDQETWGEIFAQYDHESYYCADEEFEVGETAAIIPSTMSLRILAEAAVEYAGLGFKPQALFANHIGVIFAEKAYNVLENYFTVDVENGGAE